MIVRDEILEAADREANQRPRQTDTELLEDNPDVWREWLIEKKQDLSVQFARYKVVEVSGTEEERIKAREWRVKASVFLRHIEGRLARTKVLIAEANREFEMNKPVEENPKQMVLQDIRDRLDRIIELMEVGQ